MSDACTISVINFSKCKKQIININLSFSNGDMPLKTEFKETELHFVCKTPEDTKILQIPIKLGDRVAVAMTNKPGNCVWQHC